MTSQEAKDKYKLVLKLVDELISYDEELKRCPYHLNFIMSSIYDYIINDKEQE